MDTFPVDINRQSCMMVLERNQLQLIKETREKFTEIIKKALENCDKSVTLNFNKRLWQNHRKTITIELLQRFGDFTIIFNDQDFTITKLTTDVEDIPVNINSIKIEF